jgi:hypothetical protein
MGGVKRPIAKLRFQFRIVCNVCLFEFTGQEHTSLFLIGNEAYIVGSRYGIQNIADLGIDARGIGKAFNEPSLELFMHFAICVCCYVRMCSVFIKRCGMKRLNQILLPFVSSPVFPSALVCRFLAMLRCSWSPPCKDLRSSH